MADAETMRMDAEYFKPPPRGEDLPYDDGEPMESDRHVEQMILLRESLKDHWKDRDDVFVGTNMFVYFSELHAKRQDFRGPDVFVVMDTVKRERKSWVVWEENGQMPDVVIELLSPTTEKVDRGEKMRVYAKLLRVPEYYLFDPWTGVFEGYELDVATRSYRRRELDAEGRLHSAVTGLSLGVLHGESGGMVAPWLRWFGPDGRVLPTGAERAAQESARAAQESARAEQESARAAQESARAAQESARAAQESARADHEAARAEEALRRVAELERRLGKA